MSHCLDLISLKKPQQDEIGDRFESYARIMPTDDEGHSMVGDAMSKIKELFYKLCSLKDKMSLSSGQFEKLNSHALIKKCELARPHLQLMYQKVSGNEKWIDLIRFVELM